MRIEKYFKGTTTVGIVCSDGVVIGADTRATMGGYISNTDVRKYQDRQQLGMTIAGSSWRCTGDNKDTKGPERDLQDEREQANVAKVRASLLSIILQQNKMCRSTFSCLLAGVDGEEPQLYSLDPLGGLHGGEQLHRNRKRNRGCDRIPRGEPTRKA
jgi:proteasome beta subunit